MHRQCLEEFETDLTENRAGVSVEIITKEAHTFHSNFNPSFGMIAESMDGEFAGYLSYVKKDSVICIQSLEVKPEFRGLGIGETLLVRFLESLDSDEIDKVLLDIPSRMEAFSRVLLRESFKPYAVRYWLNLKDRED